MRLGRACLICIAILAACAPAASAAACDGAPVAATYASGPWHAEALERREVARTGQTPSHAAWVGAWAMPDRSLMLAYTQATGEPDPSRRERAPEDLRTRLGVQDLAPAHDFWGLSLSAVMQRSSDGGRTWEPVRSDPFRAVYPHPYAGSGTTALSDGTILRRVNGWDLQHDASVPHTAYLQRLAPGASEWGPPEVLLDPERHTYQLSRLRQLRDGCLVATGQVWHAPAGASHRELAAAQAELLLLVSGDGGRTWKRDGLRVPPDGPSLEPNEWDVAELPGGDLLAVFRTSSSPGARDNVRRQALLVREEDGWRLMAVRDAPFPPSGHPELLATQEGVVLHVATTGVHWTGDGGASWHPLAFHPALGYAPRYYPSSLQTADGAIHVFSHTGWDAGFAEIDQAIVADRLRLSDAPVPDPGPPAPTGDAPPAAAPEALPSPAPRIATSLRAAVRVAGRRVTVRGRVRAARHAGPVPGTVQLRFRHARHGPRARAVPASRRFAETVALRGRGRWRLRASYRGNATFAPAAIGPAVIRLR